MELTAKAAAESFPSSSYRKLEQDVNALERRISDLQDEVRITKRHRNMKIPINAKLPSETLSRIFFYVREFMYYDRPVYYLAFNRSAAITWVHCIAHICSYWRSIALSEPSLWTKSFPPSLVGVQTFLERSRNLPILLDRMVTNRIRSLTPLRSLILPHMARAWKLEMSVYDSEAQNIIDILDIDMPHLTALDVQLTGPIRAEDMALRTSLSLPRLENLSHVRDLRLKFYGFSWDQVNLTNLTHLEISSDFNPAHDASAAHIFDILKNSPGLQTLALTKLVLSKDQDHNLAVAGILLPRLETLSLCQTGVSFTKLLISNAILPVIRNITLEISTKEEVILISLLTSIVRHLRHDLPKDFVFSLEGSWNYAYKCECNYHNGSSFRFQNITPLDSSQATLLCLEESDLSALQKLHCIVDEHLTVDWWKRALGSAEGLETLVIEGPFDLADLLYALTPVLNSVQGQDDTSESPSTEDNYEPTVILPSLKILAFENVAFAEPRHRSKYNDREDGGSLKHLEHCLELRAEYGSKLAKLTVPCSSRALGHMGVDLWEYTDDLYCPSDTDDESPYHSYDYGRYSDDSDFGTDIQIRSFGDLDF